MLQQELAKVSEQLKSSNDSRFKLKAKLEEAVSCKAAVEEAAQTEQQRLSFALEEMRAEMEVLKAPPTPNNNTSFVYLTPLLHRC